MGCENWPLAIAPQQSNKGGPKRSIKYSIDDGVDGGWNIAEPQADIDHMVRYVFPGIQDHHNVEDEEGGPAQDECEEHDAEDLGGLLLIGYGVCR